MIIDVLIGISFWYVVKYIDENSLGNVGLCDAIIVVLVKRMVVYNFFEL